MFTKITTTIFSGLAVAYFTHWLSKRNNKN
ncbi:type I toxin-antitoxin system Fst family toxin [Staphylococcus pettenkoferi]|uniref:Type I toxin-antitoxin system Fst family toxin n=1 Tax=Staphylococcus pettenkoferi TaxID=170573 RepID=A0A9Q4D5K8_9STAP|nr:type I toxin-antitoxin system Fst family toxin [Staphylococcus pettenkoferi]MCY1569675.1 type I toxin-antitoxin system Fst family toxin [Staphylococcus pettenkoferi]MCY1576057.1 type I toxin-antitoxin system Fst family toxin [Staphylococcus pettenkoferi]MCY1594152.1 type I toxin-antitoxin system Fst family toxin [Staphylococcus pettenkoferi]MCY1617674.1 type I toxin-antitoxin system Fst family toxin [Staphylococcus pettenkoferi]